MNPYEPPQSNLKTYESPNSTVAFLDRLRNDVLPRYYRRDLSNKVGKNCLLFKKGAYVALVMPFEEVPKGDYGSKAARDVVHRVMTCIPMVLEKGLFLIYYGPSTHWLKETAKFRVDKTALRPIILQSIHFIDPENGKNVNSRTHWGPLKFGFCGRLIEELESFC